jgi:hypothetical protein
MELDLGHNPARLRPAPRLILEAGVGTDHRVRRPTRPAPQQPGIPLVELAVALDPHGVIPALGLQQFEQRGNGEGGVTSEIAPDDRRSRVARISCQQRAQHILPAIGAVDIAGTQRTPLQIAELVGHEQRVQALGLEMTVPNSSLLIAMHRALGAVHVQCDLLWWLCRRRWNTGR